MKRPKHLEGADEAGLVGRHGEAPNHEEHAIAVRAAELDRGVRSCQRFDRVNCRQVGETEPDGLGRAGSVDHATATVSALDEVIGNEKLEGSLRARIGRAKDHRKLGSSDALRALGQGDQAAQGERRRDEARHDHIITLSA